MTDKTDTPMKTNPTIDLEAVINEPPPNPDFALTLPFESLVQRSASGGVKVPCLVKEIKFEVRTIKSIQQENFGHDVQVASVAAYGYDCEIVRQTGELKKDANGKAIPITQLEGTNLEPKRLIQFKAYWGIDYTRPKGQRPRGIHLSLRAGNGVIQSNVKGTDNRNYSVIDNEALNDASAPAAEAAKRNLLSVIRKALTLQDSKMQEFRDLLPVEQPEPDEPDNEIAKVTASANSDPLATKL